MYDFFTRAHIQAFYFIYFFYLTILIIGFDIVYISILGLLSRSL